MSTETHTIPAEFMAAAEKAAASCFSGTTVRSRQGKYAIAKAINDAVMAEREKKAATTRKKIIEALADFPHMIDSDKVEIRFDPRRPGHNALNQFLTVLEEQFSAAPKAEG